MAKVPEPLMHVVRMSFWRGLQRWLVPREVLEAEAAAARVAEHPGNPFLPGNPVLPTDYLVKSVGPIPRR